MAFYDSRAVASTPKPVIKSDPAAEPGKEFIFRLRNGREVGRARTLSQFASSVRTVPLESLEYHFGGKHFSPWLRYLKLNQLAASIEQLHSRGEKLRSDIEDLIRRV